MKQMLQIEHNKVKKTQLTIYESGQDIELATFEKQRQPQL